MNEEKFWKLLAKAIADTKDDEMINCAANIVFRFLTKDEKMINQLTNDIRNAFINDYFKDPKNRGEIINRLREGK